MSCSRVVRGIAVAAALLAGVAVPAWAANPDVLVEVVAVPTTVTFSRPDAEPPLLTFAAYEVNITNRSGNVLNHVRFAATSVVVNGPATRVAPLVESIGLTCTPTNGAMTAFDCMIGKLSGNGGSASFVVVLGTPAAGASLTDKIELSWQAFYSAGATDPSEQSSDIGTVETALGTPTDTEVKSFVRPGGGKFFTGLDGVATGGDLWATTVVVPPSLPTIAAVVERPYLQSCSADLLDGCVLSTVTVPGTFGGTGQYLEIRLRRDASSIKKGAKIANAIVSHKASLSDDDPLSDPQDPAGYVDLPSCQGLPGGAPTAEVPRCIASRTAWTKKTAPTPDHIGDWEFLILARENGRFRF